MARLIAASAVLGLLTGFADAQNSTCNGNFSLYDGTFSSTYLNGSKFNLDTYKGKVLVITNVATY
jgi:Glutathione peroxidase